MEIGKYSYSKVNIKIIRPEANLKIGKFCSIAAGCNMWLGGNHRVDWITTYPFGRIHKDVFNKFDGDGNPKTNGDVIIGNDVRIGNNVTIMSGVKIGDGSVIAANSHVVEKVKPYSVVGGNPATFYYFRFNKETIKKLIELKWWDFEDEIINEISPILCSGDVEQLFKVCDEIKIRNNQT